MMGIRVSVLGILAVCCVFTTGRADEGIADPPVGSLQNPYPGSVIVPGTFLAGTGNDVTIMPFAGEEPGILNLSAGGNTYSVVYGGNYVYLPSPVGVYMISWGIGLIQITEFLGNDIIGYTAQPTIYISYEPY